MTLYEAADNYNVTYSTHPMMIPPVSVLARGLVSKGGVLQLAADDLPMSLANLLASEGAARAIVGAISADADALSALKAVLDAPAA